ncbi:MAG TPA: polysaccharide biosynthesis tyrosine autokinase [Mucilaginibacter sp.]|jgi:capsular exopolysaccharide synthesis family protein|nr:polysaccharide biosynthesis tyrosine autokinase [Mucilaginibacter sp.]
MEETDRIKQKLPNQEIDYFKIGKILLSRWYWIVGSLIVCTIVANVYLWYTPKTYSTSAVMKFEEKKSELPEIGGVSSVPDRASASHIQTEIVVLQSTPLLLNAIKQLDYRMSFFVVGRVLNRTSELYPNKPIDVELVKFDTLNFFRDLVTFRPINRNSFTISYKNGPREIHYTYRYDTPFTIGPTTFSIKYPGDLPNSTSYLFKLNSAGDFLGRVAGGFHASETSKNSNIISVQQVDSNPQFAADILNAIMREYLNYDRYQRTLSTSQMIQFIDSQLDFLSKQVKGSANSIKQFKENKKMMDINTATDQMVGKAKDIDAQRSLLKIQLLALDQLRQQIIQEKQDVSLSFNLGGVVDPQLDEIIVNLNNLLVEKNSLAKTYNASSQPIQDINQQILQLKNSIFNSINSSKAQVESKIKYLDEQIAPVNQQIAQLPATEQDLVSLKRDFDINDKVYSYLSEKKLDAQINSAGVLPGATIIDIAQPNFGPVSPDEKGIHRNAIIFGLALGLGAIILIRVTNPYIYDKETIESLTTIPIIGVIRKFPEEIDEFSSQILAIARPKSIFAESVRSVRTNLSFLASEKTSKIICITSEVAGEGKSFVAVNLSSTLSLIEKKVILIAADLRRSKLHKTFNVPNDIGLSNYLANQCTEEDIVMHSNHASLDFIISGPVPPNPSELLHTDRMVQLVASLRDKYEIIMIDTAPIGLVSDAIPLIRMSDINLFVIRSGKSKFYAATVPQRIAHEYHLDNTVIVLNAYAEDLLHSRYYTTKFTGENYGSRYYYYSDYSGYESSGYYIDEKKKKWWDIRGWFNR